MPVLWKRTPAGITARPPDEIDWSAPERQTRAVAEFLAGAIDDDDPTADRKPPKVISPKRPVLGMDGEGEQACAVRLRA